MRGEALQAGGYLPVDSNLVLDQELWIRIAARYPLVHVDGFWGVERSHDSAKTISLAAQYGPDAFALVEALKADPLFKPTLDAHGREIDAGLHIFSARRLIDARQPRPALQHFRQALRLAPRRVARVWFKVLQGLGGAVGLGGLFLVYRSTRRRLQHGTTRLVVDAGGAHWDTGSAEGAA
jgi:hypothetical protein